MTSAGVYTYTVLACDQKQNTTRFSFHINKGVLLSLISNTKLSVLVCYV